MERAETIAALRELLREVGLLPLADGVTGGVCFAARSGARVVDQRQVVASFAPLLAPLAVEQAWGLYLDVRLREIHRQLIGQGGSTHAPIRPREVFRPAVQVGASYVVLIHNHPSGNPEPSAQDRQLTRRLAQAGRVLGIEFADHLVIGRDGWRSLAGYCEDP